MKTQILRKCATTCLIILFTGLAGNLTAEGWYNSIWTYRNSHVINSAMNAGTNYSVEIDVNFGSGTNSGANVYCNGNCNANFGDIRFTASDGTTLLSYWLKGYTSSANAVFWVKIAGDLSTTSQTIYMYYGNSLATTTSDPNQAFIFYSNGTTTAGWTLSGTVGTDGNELYANEHATGGANYMCRDLSGAYGTNTLTTFNVLTDNGNLGNFFFLCNASGAGQMYRLDSRGSGNYSGFATTTSWNAWSNPSGGTYSTYGTWYRFGIAITSTSSATLYYDNTTSQDPYAGTTLGTYSITNSGTWIGLNGDMLGNGSLQTRWDNIITRRYVNPEPAHSTWGVTEIIIGNNTLDFANGTHGSLCGSADEDNVLVLTAPAGTVFVCVNFSSFGNPPGSCPDFTIGSCHASTSQSFAESQMLGENEVIFWATTSTFGDPCTGSPKWLDIIATYAQPVCQGTLPATITGSLPTGGNGSYTYLWESSTTGYSGGFSAAPGTN
ncbi:MAG: DUF2341 domain-containing protein [Bacteroidetes bacterium]|nr:DUF2341 domain-containing protein [Bacteroidota bacterium]